MSVLGVLATGLVSAPSPSCADAVLNDWYDGTLDGTYDPHCYRNAIRALPEDVRVYTTAVDDISRALRQRLTDEGATAATGRSPRSLSGVRRTESRRHTPARVAVEPTTEARRPPLPLLLLAAVVVVLATGTAAAVALRRVRRRRA